MKTIYIEEKQWQSHTLNRELGRAVGDTGRIAGFCRRDAANLWAGEDKVIDLAAWKTENLVDLDGLESAGEPESGLAQYEGRELVRHRRRKNRSALMLGELAATLAAMGVMAVMILMVVVF